MSMAAISPVHGFRRFGFSFLSLSCVLLLQSATGRELKLALLVMRHGDRTPFNTYPTDPYKEDIWPQGFQQLTTAGMTQHYMLGQLLRERYNPLLISDEYRPKELYVRSTDWDRNIMSAQANLAGLYRPTKEQFWNNGIPWRPVPVHTVPFKDDQFYAPARNCTRFNKLVEETMKMDKVKDKVKSNEKFVSELAGHTGYDVKTLLDFSNRKIWNIYDTLLAQKRNGYKLPKWATPKVLNQLEEMLTDRLIAVYGLHKREEKSRLQAGRLLKIIMGRIDTTVKSGPEAKLVICSAYGVTIVTLQIALNVFERTLPGYAACYFIELYQENNGEYTVEMHYRDSYKKNELTPVILPGCTAACPLEKFKKLVAPVIPENWEQECNK